MLCPHAIKARATAVEQTPALISKLRKHRRPNGRRARRDDAKRATSVALKETIVQEQIEIYISKRQERNVSGTIAIELSSEGG